MHLLFSSSLDSAGGQSSRRRCQRALDETGARLERSAASGWSRPRRLVQCGIQCGILLPTPDPIKYFQYFSPCLRLKSQPRAEPDGGRFPNTTT
jgi:hypothetical protein